MRKILLAAALLTAISCNMTKDKNYIAPSSQTPSGVLTEDILLQLGRLGDPQISPDSTKILYGVSYTCIEQNRSCRNLFTLEMATGDKKQISFEGKSIANARWFEDGIIYLQGGQIKWAPLSRKGLLNTKKAVTISNVPEGVEEFSISPDHSKLMYISRVKSHVDTPKDVYADLPLAKAYSTEDLMYRHWDHFVEQIPHTFVSAFEIAENSVTEESSTDILSEEEKFYELPYEPFGGLEQLCWSPDSKSIAYSCKKKMGRDYAFSTNTEIFLYDIESASTRNISKGGGYDTCPVFSPDGNSLIYLSMRRDGYEADQVRLILVNMTDSSKKDLTADFDYNVNSAIWTADGENIIFSSLKDGLQGIFSCNVASGEIIRLTKDDLWYDFETPFFVEGNNLYTTYCSMSFPAEICKYDVETGEIVNLSKENDHLLSGLKDVTYEQWYLKTVDDKDMLTWVVFPPEFDTVNKYPSIVILLGGPQGTLSQGWSYRWNYRLMASHGYVVVLPNRRGTTAFGQEWCEQISGDYPGLNMQDYLTAAREIKQQNYIGKVAGCGASYGGYSVFNLAGTHEDVFDCFIAHAGIFNQEQMYMTTEEMWFPNFDNGGLAEFRKDSKATIGPKGDGRTFGGIRQGGSPWSNKPEAVRHYANSPHKKVTKWHTPILVIHGGSDYRVPVEQGMAAFNAAQMMGVESKLIIFPEENHWILKPQNALYWHREYFDWLDKHCK